MTNHYSHAALPFPVKGARYTVPIPYLDADGDPTDPTTPDTEISKDGGAFTDCTEEVSTITGSNGAGYITLTGAEMDASLIFLCAKVASGPKATLATLVPRVLPAIHSGTAQAGGATSITLQSTASALAGSAYSGMIVRTTGGTGGGGTGGANNQARVITDYNASTQVATVAPAWETNPSSDTTYEILRPDSIGVTAANVVAFGGTAGTFVSGIPQASLTTSAINSVADQVWDEDITTHRAANGAGAMLQPLHSGACQNGGTTTTVKLAAGASAIDDYYNGDRLTGWVTADGTNKFSDYILDYDGATRVATVTGIPVSPDSSYTYVVWPGGTIPGASAPSANDNAAAVWNALWASYTASGSFGERFGAIRRNTFASVASSSAMTLDAGASTSVNHYKYATLRLLSGTYAGESRQIIGHTAGRVVTVSPAFTGAPAGGDAYIIEPLGIDAATVETIVDGIWDEPRAGHGTAGTYGEYVYADLTRLNGDAVATANAEAFFDGTGYAGTNNVIPTVTNVTNAVSANVTAISGDGPAADNLEAMLDGTGGVNLTAAFIGNITGNLSGSVGSVTGAVGSVTGAVGSVTGAVGSVTAGVTVTTNNDKTGYRLSATGVDDIWDEPITEPSSVFAWASATPRNIVGFLGQMNRNKQTLNKTTGAFVLRNNADGADVGTATHTDDGTTTTRGKVS